MVEELEHQAAVFKLMVAGQVVVLLRVLRLVTVLMASVAAVEGLRRMQEVTLPTVAGEAVEELLVRVSLVVHRFMAVEVAAEAAELAVLM